jgi:hypothetical protein
MENTDESVNIKDKYNEEIKNFLKKCSIHYNNIEDLEGLLICRDVLLHDQTYLNVLDDIPMIKKYFSSSSMTCLQETAYISQKWPLLNLVRQILKANNFVMTPIRKSAGYDKDKIEKMKSK